MFRPVRTRLGRSHHRHRRRDRGSAVRVLQQDQLRMERLERGQPARRRLPRKLWKQRRSRSEKRLPGPSCRWAPVTVRRSQRRGRRWTLARQWSVVFRSYSIYPPDHLFLDSAPNIGPFISRWELEKFKNLLKQKF